jgi:hypothetical protein
MDKRKNLNKLKPLKDNQLIKSKVDVKKFLLLKYMYKIICVMKMISEIDGDHLKKPDDLLTSYFIFKIELVSIFMKQNYSYFKFYFFYAIRTFLYTCFHIDLYIFSLNLSSNSNGKFSTSRRLHRYLVLRRMRICGLRE